MSATCNAAVSVPFAAGLNSTEMVQLAAAASVLPQVVDLIRNEDLSVPLMVIPPLLMSSVPLPVFFKVTTLAALVDPIFVLAKVRVLGVSETTGAADDAPVPVRAAV